MKTKLLVGITAVAAGICAVSCSDTDKPIAAGHGHIALTADVDGELLTASRAAVDFGVTAEDLSVKLTSEDGSYSHTWNRLSEFPVDQDFKAGKYTIEAFYGSADNAGFECPHFYASSELTVRDSEPTKVNLTATLANAMVSVEYTEAFKSYMSQWDAYVTTGASEIEYTSTETRPVFVHPGVVVVDIDFTKQNGTQAKVQAASFTAEARRHYHITVDVNGGQVGDGTLTVTYDDQVDQEEVEIDLSDEILSAPAPVFTTEGFTSGQEDVCVPGETPDGTRVVNLMARAGIASLILTTHSASLQNQGLPEEIDLTRATPSQQALLSSLGLDVKGAYRNPDKMAVVDFSNVASHITLGQTENTNVFTLNVRDRGGKVAEPVTYSIIMEPLVLELDNPSVLTDGATTLMMDLTYNGRNPEKDVTVEYHNDYGTWTDAHATGFTPVNRSSQKYRVTLTVPGNESNVILRARCGNATASAEVSVERSPLPYAEINASKAFATHATATVYMSGNPVSLPSGAKVSYSTDGTNWTAFSDGLKATGLTPGTTYSLAVILEDGSHGRVTSFTTENATQLTNGNMETWDNTASGNNWERWDVSGWATYNPMTTGNTGTRENTAYVNRSGTAQSTDAKEGSYAAELRTIGWGAGNSAVGSISGSNPKYITKGMLYLGTSPTQYSEMASQITEGITFSSRPSAISFWYKYAHKNAADYGGFKVWVKDAAGNIIASGSMSNLNASQYTQVEVPLTYSENAGKAASIYVEFSSSDHPSWDTRSKDWFTVPSFGNLSNGVFQGSSMFVDNITLKY
ncbi:MAG: DUF4493 domain-containing protein [Muribaculaceae bacterium]|nr:DUF4493 domain-containing protein [Muribaculaceae bacterium]